MENIEPTFVPVDRWPKEKTKDRRRAPFRTSFNKTLTELKKELGKISAKNVHIELYLTRGDIRIDGWPRAGAKPSEPGVIVRFEGKQGPIALPCDTYDEWQDNLRAICLTLENLRAVDRYGVTQHGEQYKGFLALPPPVISLAPSVSKEDAALFFDAHNSTYEYEEILSDWGACEYAYKEARKRLHPDKGGSKEAWNFLQESWRVLMVHHGK